MFSIIDALDCHPERSERSAVLLWFEEMRIFENRSLAALGMTALLYGIASFQRVLAEWLTTEEPENPIHEASRHATPPASGAADADRTWGSDPPTCHP